VNVALLRSFQQWTYSCSFFLRSDFRNPRNTAVRGVAGMLGVRNGSTMLQLCHVAPDCNLVTLIFWTSQLFVFIVRVLYFWSFWGRQLIVS